MAVVAGVDIGAGTAKTVILSERQIVSCCIFPTGHDSAETARKTLDEALKKASFRFNEVEKIIATGCSRNIIPFANRAVTEILCHAR